MFLAAKNWETQMNMHNFIIHTANMQRFGGMCSHYDCAEISEPNEDKKMTSKVSFLIKYIHNVN